MIKRLITIVGILVLLLFSATFLFLYRTSKESSYNVIIISIDTLRVDHLGIYGYEKNTSPNLDRFASENIVFEQAIAQAPFTLSSHASIFSSQYPSAHGVLGLESRLISSKITLAEVLGENGYETAAFVGGGELESRFGFSQGFDVYIDKGGNFFDTTIPLATVWLQEEKREKFFLYMQGYDVHGPYNKPKPFNHMFDEDYEGVLVDHKQFWFDYRENDERSILHRIKKIDGKPFLVLEDKTIPLTDRDIEHIVAHYDGGIRYTDNLIESFFDTLKEMNLYDNSIIIVLAGHGESLGDDLARPDVNTGRLFGHGQLYEELVHVPLFIKHPAFQAQRISIQVQLIDLFPTILDFLNISQSKEVQQEIQGESFLPTLKGRADERFNEYVYGEAGVRFVRTEEWKLISGGEEIFALYNLQDDPKETSNVINEQPIVASNLKKKILEQFFQNLEKKSQLQLN